MSMSETLRRKKVQEGVAHYQARRLEHAKAVCEEVLRSVPADPDALQLKGLVLHDLGQPEAALECLDRAVSVAPDAQSLFNRGTVLRTLGRLPEAIEHYREALRLRPGTFQFVASLAQACYLADRWKECIAYCDQILVMDARNLGALNHRGLCHFRLGDLDEFERNIQMARAVAPDHAETLLNLGVLQLHRGHLTAALETNLAVTRARPGHAPAWENLGTTYFQLGRGEDSRAAFARAFELDPSLTNRLRRDLALSYIPDSRAGIEDSRADYARHLDELTRQGSGVALPSAALYGNSSFLLAYHGENDAPLMRKLATMYLALCPALDFRAPHLEAPRPPETRLRIGFFSVNTHDHSVSRCFAGLIAKLAADPRFEVVLISTHNPASSGTNLYHDFSGRLVHVPRQYLAAREAIAAEHLDLLVYQDIGMDELSYFLAFGRLARIQCVLGGHPVTTGIPNVDYFISSALAEPPDAQDHYTERLLTVPRFPTLFDHPAVPQPLKSRTGLGLPASGSIYLCPMMLQKIHPDFDEAIRGILERDPTGHVVLFKHYSARWEEPLMARFERSIAPEPRSRILFLPWIHDYGDFIAVNAHASVVLDPFHFGIGSTVIATFAVGTPIVTRPGAYMRGRVGFALCTLLELPECVASSPEDYVTRAVAIATDPALQQRLRERILQNKGRLYDDERAVSDLAGLFARLTLEETQMMEPLPRDAIPLSRA